MERLLLVEHHLLFGEGLALLLQWRTGLSSVQGGSLAEAERILEDADQKPACAIVDLDLPEGDGTELLKLLDGVPTLALCKGCSLEHRAQAFESGAVEVLHTTGPVENIVAAVERLIGQASRAEQRHPSF